MEPLVFVYYLCDTKKNVQGGDYNREKDVEVLREKLNCSAHRVTLRCKHITIFVNDNKLWIPMYIRNVHELGIYSPHSLLIDLFHLDTMTKENNLTYHIINTTKTF